MELNTNTILISVGIILVAVELVLGVATGFDLVLLGTCLIGGGVVGVFTGNPQIGLMVSAILATLYIFLGRSLIKKKLLTKSSKSNADALVGQSGSVTKKIILDSPGQVLVDGELWRAKSATNLEVGTKVTIVDVDGVTVNVIKSS